MSRRVVIGRKGNGQMGLAVSLPGVDVMSTTPSGPGLSFDDSMPGIVKVFMSGAVGVPDGTDGAGRPNTATVSHGLGYVPFIEARLLSDSTIFDDYFNLGSAQPSNPYSGIPCKLNSSSIIFSNVQTQLASPINGTLAEYTGYNAYYIIYAVSVPS